MSNAEEVERLIDSISWGGRYIYARDLDGPRVVVIHPLGAKERNFLTFIHQQALNEALDGGALNKLELYKVYKEKGLWTAADDDALELLGKDVEKLEELVKLGQANKAHRRQLQIIKERRNKLYSKRRELFSISAESYADEMRMLAVVFTSAYDEMDVKLWTSWNGFLTSTNDVLVTSILHELNTTISYLDLPTVRRIARSPSWRFRWGGAKSIGDLFGKPICEFNTDQSALLYWSQVYDSVYESMERPPDHIIDDDAALDAWFDQQDKKRKSESVSEGKSGIGRTELSPRIRRHGEIFVVVNKDINPNAPTVEQVEGLNPEFVRKFKAKEAERIRAAGNIREQDLRHRSDKVARKIIGSNDAVIGRNSFGQGGKKSGKILPGGTL